MRLQQQPSVTEGARVTLWWPGRLGIEGAVGYAPSALWSSLYGLTYPAHVLTASAKARLRVTPPAARAALQVAAGVGLVGHGGYAYLPWYDGPSTFFGGIASAGAVIKLVRWVGVRFDAEDFVYSAHLGRGTRSGGANGVCDVYVGSPTLSAT